MAGGDGRHERTRRQALRRGAGTPGRVAGPGEGDEPEPMNTKPALGGVAAIVILGLASGQVPAHGQQGAAAAVKTVADAGEFQLQAASANVKQPGNPVKIRIFRWSTDE